MSREPLVLFGQRTLFLWERVAAERPGEGVTIFADVRALIQNEERQVFGVAHERHRSPDEFLQ